MGDSQRRNSGLIRWLRSLREGLIVEDKSPPSVTPLLEEGIIRLPPKRAWPGMRQETVFVLDRSLSMGKKDFKPTRLDGAKGGVEAALEKRTHLSPDDRVALVAFNGIATVESPLVSLSETAGLKTRLACLTPDDGTDLAAGLTAACGLFREAEPRTRDRLLRRVLLLTDGHGGKPKRVAQTLKTDLAVLLEVIGIGGDPAEVNEELLRQVATTDETGFTHYWFIDDTSRLVQHYEDLATGLVWKGQTR